MTGDTLNAISPLDGRYARKLDSLRVHFSESALMRYRVLVELTWLIRLSEEPAISELPPFDPQTRARILKLADDFDGKDAARIKEIESRTNHDVKAVEYWLQETLESRLGLHGLTPFLHFACTSEDINNLAYALMLSRSRSAVLLPMMRKLSATLTAMAERYADVPMLSRTHGQAASPTTVGKEVANFVHRLDRQANTLEAVPALGKLNGAVGNYNAHFAAYPEADWPAIAARAIEQLGLTLNPYTVQIEPHDWIAEYCDALARFDNVVIDLCRDFWGYISIGYFRQQTVAGEVGSSTMPHKVNPIDFENAEGNMGCANALLGHMSAKLPLSRWQRDLTDSTVLRNLGVAVGHAVLALDSLNKGLGKIDVDTVALDRDLDANWEVLGEAIQTVMRRYGVEDAYEQLKGLTRGRRVGSAELAAFVDGLAIPDTAKQALRTLTPHTYLGNAATAARGLRER